MTVIKSMILQQRFVHIHIIKEIECCGQGASTKVKVFAFACKLLTLA